MRVVRLARPFWLVVVLMAALAISSGRVTAQTKPALRSKAFFDPQQTLLDGGQRLRLTGPLGCDQGVTIQLRLAVTQRLTAAAAVDQQWQGVCSGEPSQQWLQEVNALEGTTFAPGDAFACGVAVVRRADGTIADVSQWCDSVVLLAEGQG